MNLKEYRKKLMQDPETAAAYQKLRPKLELGRRILDLRLERGWTQKELAKRAGTKQANISRLENALLNPSLDMLQKVADAFGEPLDIRVGSEEAVDVHVPEPATETAGGDTVRVFSIDSGNLVGISRSGTRVVVKSEFFYAEEAGTPSAIPPLVDPVDWFDHAGGAVRLERPVA